MDVLPSHDADAVARGVTGTSAQGDVDNDASDMPDLARDIDPVTRDPVRLTFSPQAPVTRHQDPPHAALTRLSEADVEQRYDRVAKAFKIESFDGSVEPGAIDSGVSTWFSKFETLLETQEDIFRVQLPESMKRALLLQNLTGTASIWYMANRHDFRFRSLHRIGRELKREFGCQLSKATVGQVVAAERKKPWETYREYSIRLRVMAAATTRDGMETIDSNSLALSSFITNAWPKHSDTLKMVIREDSTRPTIELDRAIARLMQLREIKVHTHLYPEPLKVKKCQQESAKEQTMPRNVLHTRNAISPRPNVTNVVNWGIPQTSTIPSQLVKEVAWHTQCVSVFDPGIDGAPTIDSGSTYHITGTRSKLSELRDCESHAVEIADGGLICGTQMGKMIVDHLKGTILDDVYAPGFSQTLKKLIDQGIKVGVTEKDCLVYGEPILKGSIHRGASRPQAAPDEVCHGDLAGPFQRSYHGHKYYYALKWRGHTSIYFLKTKDEATQCFRSYVNMVNRRFGKLNSFKIYRSDNGGEFMAGDFKKVCDDEGIWTEMSEPEVHHQNGVIERTHRTIANDARALMIQAKLPHFLWEYAARSAVYSRNRVLSRNDKTTTPFEKFWGRKPDLKLLKTFGQKCVVLIPPSKRSTQYQFKPKENVEIENEDCNSESESTAAQPKLANNSPAKKNTGSSSGLVESRHDPRRRESKTEIGTVPRRSTRIANRSISAALSATDSTLRGTIHEPVNLRAARASREWHLWEKAIQEKIVALKANDTFDLVEPPTGANIIGSTIVFRVKLNETGEVERFKARICAQGFTQEFLKDYVETYAPVARLNSIRVFLALATQKGMRIRQGDVPLAYVKAGLSETIYVRQPHGFEEGSLTKVWRLK
ncbi:unnamed protein product [Phytophthora fragariaefolia]|uniref:Unnamed protein product n=1 Tax=Phytophthora fragariaefolia TaxID=1490495 RepID=A0A9W6XA42_9STRA|nr:unnamed protein product [Phytophthora fragariaefolia]